MRYFPLTDDDRKKILGLCHVSSFEELTKQIPEKLRIKGLLDLEPAMHETELIDHLQALGKKNQARRMQSHLGQGAYDHSWPVVIDQLSNRGEFLTAYTPYQPEISQGTLQVIFEYQSMIAELLGTEVSNASLYDGGSATVEGVLMAARLQGRKSGTVYISEGTYPYVRQILETYLLPLGFKIETWWADPKTFCSTQKTLLTEHVPYKIPTGDDAPIAVFLQSPNQWGLIEDWSELKSTAQQLNTQSVASVTHAHSVVLFEAPGNEDIDVVVGEGQTLGIPVGFGGPHLGLMGCRKKDVRQLPGRLVGQTEDARGQTAYCITLATREQHIRREKATSNICSNQNLMALRACIYMTLMGPEGMEKVARLSYGNAQYAKQLLQTVLEKKNIQDIKILNGDHFNEICLLSKPKHRLWIDQMLGDAEKEGLIVGCPVDVPSASGFVKGLSIAFTEKHSAAQIEKLVNSITKELR